MDLGQLSAPKNRKMVIGVGVGVAVILGWYLFIHKPSTAAAAQKTTLPPGTKPGGAPGGAAPGSGAAQPMYTQATTLMAPAQITTAPPAPQIDYQAQKAYEALGNLTSLADSDGVARYPGKWGQSTWPPFKGQMFQQLSDAISKYQTAHGLPVTGNADQGTIDDMNAYYDKMNYLNQTDPYFSLSTINLG
jgi:hypothetical protein